jgi:RES domain-containing protein
MLYASSSLSLACLEILVHIREPHLPADCGWVRITIPDRLMEKATDDLEAADENACREFGSTWAVSGRRPAVEVPSVIVPVERNVLLNPRHKDFGSLSFSEPEAFRFDPRLLKLGPAPL